MNIYQKLVEVRKAVPYLQKEADGHQYKYVSSSQVLAAVRRKMDEVGLMLIPEVVGKSVSSDMVEGTDNKGQPKHTFTYFTELDIRFTWINVENPDEKIVCAWYGQGIDTAGEKGVGKALTYAEKYFLLKTFNIATDKDDPDSFQQKEEQKHNPGAKPADKSQKSSITSAIKALGINKSTFESILANLNIENYASITHDQANLLIDALANYHPQEAANA